MRSQREFCIIMAVYNTAAFLNEAVESVIAQNIGFSENVNLILVDDGSDDGSGDACDKYVAKYPDNITAIHIPHSGVYAARNAGLEKLNGKYVNFMDSDDKLSSDALLHVKSFFDTCNEICDVLAIPMHYFGRKNDAHEGNIKFGDVPRVVNLEEDWSVTQKSCASAFFVNSAVEKLRFDECSVAEGDIGFVQRVMLKKQRLALMPQAVYYYRIREFSQFPAIRFDNTMEEWYTAPLDIFANNIICEAEKLYGFVPKYLQNAVLDELKWRLRVRVIHVGIMNEQQCTQYHERLTRLCSGFEDDVIMAQSDIWIEHKSFLLHLKYGHLPEKEKSEKDVLYKFSDKAVFRASDFVVRMDFMTIREDMFVFEGWVPFFHFIDEQPDKMFALVNGKRIPLETTERFEKGQALGETLYDRMGFRLEVPVKDLGDKMKLEFYRDYGGSNVKRNVIRFDRHCPLSKMYTRSYYTRFGWELRHSNGSIVASRAKYFGLKSLFGLLAEMFIRKKRGARVAVFFRLFRFFVKPFLHKQIWLISDRIDKAGDNGEAFFRFMCRTHKKGIKFYYVIEKDTEGYREMKKIGKVVPYLSLRHKLILLLADKTISSQGEVYIKRPFVGDYANYCDILSDQQFVFLQHGVIMHDLSGWLNRYNVNIAGFVTSARGEYESICAPQYYYDNSQVWLTGLPRFDRLYHDEKKIITVMPTWRNYLVSDIDPATGKRQLNEDFTKSDYFVFYNALLNDKRFLEITKKFGYTVQFLPHPNIVSFIDTFNRSEGVRFLDLDAKYSEVYAQSDLIVTDYSSAAFDFTYLYKPIVYCQFDSERVLSGGHTFARGYFDYGRDGFGEIETTVDATVDRVIEYLENGCVLKEKYRNRVDKFFAYIDKNNCQRVYDKIRELD